MGKSISFNRQTKTRLEIIRPITKKWSPISDHTPVSLFLPISVECLKIETVKISSRTIISVAFSLFLRSTFQNSLTLLVFYRTHNYIQFLKIIASILRLHNQETRLTSTVFCRLHRIQPSLLVPFDVRL